MAIAADNIPTEAKSTDKLAGFVAVAARQWISETGTSCRRTGRIKIGMICGHGKIEC